jgi:HAMP domain-containing protein
MSEQHTATAVTAGAVVGAFLMARAAARLQSRRGRRPDAARPLRRRTLRTPPPAATSQDVGLSAVHEAEEHVRDCWHRMRARTDFPD